MPRIKSKFETEVHFGLLVIIFLLLFVNFLSNVVLYHARAAQAVSAELDVHTATIKISRVLRDNGHRPLSKKQLERLGKEYSLTDILVIDSQPEDDEPETKRKWFIELAAKYPPARVPDLARMLIGAETQQLARGDGQEYFYVTPISVDDRRKLLVLSLNLPELAYLEDAGFIIQLAALGSFIAVLLVYIFLSRFIFGPIRRITKEARRAGRAVDDGENEIEAVAADYEKIIRELRQNEEELLRLNKEVQERAASLEQFNQYLLASIDSGIVTLGEDGKLLSDNDAARRLLGAEQCLLGAKNNSLVGISYKELFSGCPEFIEDVSAVLNSGNIIPYRELEWKDLQGNRRDFGITLSIIRDDRDNRVGLAVLINDLTELHDLHRVLDQQKRLAALGEMAAGLAHQIRNSLGAIAGFGTLVKRRTEAENILSSIESLLHETVGAETLISRFLSFARPLSLERTSFTVNDFLREIIDSFRVRPSCSLIEFDISCEGAREYSGDSVLLKQAVSNIVDNAVIACEGLSGLISIRAENSANELTITVTDSGSGIPKDEIDKLFTPFFSSRPSGSGLGLSLAGKVVDLHNGQIMVESQLGKGSSFTIHLPSKASVASVTSVTNPAATPKEQLLS